jgi:hypothetical protein
MIARLRPFALAACIGAAVVAAAAGWAESDPELTRTDARHFVAEAFAAAGVQPARIVGGPLGGTYHSEETGPGGVPAWRVRVQLGKEKRVAGLWIHRVEARAVSLQEGKKRFVTDDQFRRLRAFAFDDAADRRRRRDIAGTVGALAVIGAAAALIRQDRRGAA